MWMLCDLLIAASLYVLLRRLERAEDKIRGLMATRDAARGGRS